MQWRWETYFFFYTRQTSSLRFGGTFWVLRKESSRVTRWVHSYSAWIEVDPNALSLSRCDLTVAYFDNVTLRDTIDSLGGEVVDFQRRASSIRFTLNVKKCEIMGLNQVSRNMWEGTDFAKFCLEPSMEVANLLGAPLFSEGLNTYLGLQHRTQQILRQRLLLMSAFFLFKYCLTMPKWLHLLRSSPSFESSDLLHDTLQHEIYLQ